MATLDESMTPFALINSSKVVIFPPFMFSETLNPFLHGFNIL